MLIRPRYSRDNGSVCIYILIGDRFTGRNQEVALPLTVRFAEKVVVAQHEQFIKLSFQVLSFAHANVFSKNVSLYPKGSGAQYLCERQLRASEYRIWNSWCQPPQSALPASSASS